MRDTVVDPSLPRGQNGRMRAHRERATAALTILALATLSLGGICGGWEPSSEARAACCAMAGHQSDGKAADDCCAAGEERQHGQTSGSPPAIGPSLSELPLPFPESSGSRNFRPLDDPLDQSRSSTVTRLLHCVFLI